MLLDKYCRGICRAEVAAVAERCVGFWTRTSRRRPNHSFVSHIRKQFIQCVVAQSRAWVRISSKPEGGGAYARGRGVPSKAVDPSRLSREHWRRNTCAVEPSHTVTSVAAFSLSLSHRAVHRPVTIPTPSSLKHVQGGHGTGKTGNLVLTFSRQGKHREFCSDTGKNLLT